MRIFITTLILAVLTACSNSPTIQKQDTADYLALGDSISNIAQATLLKNVSSAVEQGGIEYAVDFCNLNAFSITDSLSKEYSAHITRLSDKNRNPSNAISSESDATAWEKIQSEQAAFTQAADDGTVYYYKPIYTAMPTCIKCHGTADDITESVAEVIREKYPNDLATGYHLGDLRGMWKIHFD